MSSVVKLSLSLLLVAFSAYLNTAAQTRNVTNIQPAGIAWRVLGDWRQQPPADAAIRSDQGNPPKILSTGALILPGALLLPTKMQGTHSITIFLPDGQRIFYECFTTEDCTRGFRVPALTETPDIFAVRMLRQMSSVLLRNAGKEQFDGILPTSETSLPHATFARLDEALLTLDGHGNVTLGGLLSTLPNGDYTYKLRSLGQRHSTEISGKLKKASEKCVFSLPAAGLYELVITDAQNTDRINFFLAAIHQAQSSRFSAFPKAKDLLAAWTAQYYGWPTHELLRAYLEALM